MLARPIAPCLEVWYLRAMRKKGSLAEWELRRNLAVNLLDQGMEPAAVANALNVDAQTVRAWRRAYLARGRQALASRKPPGRPARLSFEQRQRLAEMLLKTPAECGFDKYLWTQQLIADLVQREFGVSYHHDHIGVILEQMDFTHQKPARRARERDEPAIEAWRREVWPALQKKTPRPTA
jgi:transposase